MGTEKYSFRDALGRIQPEDIVEVICYSGYRSDESPRKIILKDQSFKVEEVLERKRERRGRRILDVFICRVENSIVRLEKPEGCNWRIKIRNKI